MFQVFIQEQKRNFVERGGGNLKNSNLFANLVSYFGPLAHYKFCSNYFFFTKTAKNFTL
jgi:hypothetical protein